uniref:Uncharacterized protein n=1 Tax=Calcidiscus leptoporus TaxID=127549 RepID=A0A7S0JCT0_9EUKA
MAGTYHYKITLGDEISAKPFGEMADEMPECSAADMYTLEKQIYDACAEKSGFPTFTYQNSMVSESTSLDGAAFLGGVQCSCRVGCNLFTDGHIHSLRRSLLLSGSGLHA